MAMLTQMKVWATSDISAIGPVSQMVRAIRSSIYKKAVAQFDKNVKQRYHDLESIHATIFDAIQHTPNDRNRVLDLTLETAQKLSFTTTEINNILYAVNRYMLQHERVEELRNNRTDYLS